MSVLTAGSNALITNAQAFTPLAFRSGDAERLRALAAFSVVAVAPAQISDIIARENEVIKSYDTNWAIYAAAMDPGEESIDGNSFNAASRQTTATFNKIIAAEKAGEAGHGRRFNSNRFR